MPNTTPTAAEIAAATVEYQKQKDVLSLLNDQFDEIESSLTDIATKQIQFVKSSEAGKRQISELKSIYNSLSKTARTLSSYTEDFSNGLLETKDISKTLRDISRDEDRIQRQINLAYKDKNAKLLGQLQLELQQLDAEKKAALTLKEQNELIDEATGLTGNLLKGLAKLPIIGESINFGEINQNMRQAAGNSNVFAAGLKTAGKQLKEGLKDPLIQAAALAIIYKKIWDLNKDLDQTLTDQARQLGVSKELSKELYDQAYAYSNTTKDSFVTAERLTKAGLELRGALNSSVDLGNQNAEAAARFSHYYGLSAESGAKLVELGVEQGQNGLDILNITAKTYNEQKRQNGGTLQLQKVLDKVSGTSSDILVKFKGNTQALVAAVMNADRLGLSLDKVDQIGESLLNFESSIENELKAELLTGKAINLEKAREAALSGDLTKLTNEVAQQVGNIHNFEKMNVIQRKAYAEAFGMTVQDMSTMLRKQEFEAKLGDKAKASAEEQLKYAKEHNIEVADAVRQQLEQKSLADEQKEIMDKLRQILVKITSGPMLTLFHQMEKILGFVGKMLSGFGSITGGGLGNALGAALLTLPAAFMVMKALRGTRINPMVVEIAGGAGMGVKPGMTPTMGPAGTAGGTFYKGGQFLPGGGRAPAGGITVPSPGMAGTGGGFKGFMGSGMGLGLAGMGVGMLTAGVTSNMEAGEGKTAVGALGGAASGALMGAAFGPWGAAIGGLIGGIGGLVSGLEEDRAKRKAEEAAKRDADKKTNDLLESLAVRPINLQVGPEKMNNALNQYGKSALEN
jgi:hypothetical protein